MNWPAILLVSPWFVAAIASLALAAITWRHRGQPGAVPLVAAALLAAEWAFFGGLELLAVDFDTALIWANLQYVGVCALPTACLAFALDHAGLRRFLTGGRLVLLSIVPAIGMVVVWTEPGWTLMRHDFGWHRIGLLHVMSKQWGPALWVTAFYSYVILLVATVLIGWTLRRYRLYRGQAAGLLVGIALPWLWNTLYLTRVIDLGGVDANPVVFVLSVVAWTFSLLRYRLFDIAPIAHDAVFDGLRDGVIALDLSHRIVDVNPTGALILGHDASKLVGRPLAEVLPAGIRLEIPERGQFRSEARGCVAGEDRQFDLLLSELVDRDRRLTGRLLVWRDVTERRRAEAERELLVVELQAALAQVRRLSGLLPICAHCKKIRDDEGYWRDVEVYVHDHSEADFTHGICPDCISTHYSKYFPERQARPTGSLQAESAPAPGAAD